jgi:biotin carboxyl carrier protein
VTERGPGLYEVRIGDRVHVVDAFKHDYGTLSLVVGTQSYTATLDERGAKVHVRVRDSVYPLELVDEWRLGMRRAPGRLTPSGRQAVVARLPARVLKVLAQTGDAVRQGQALVIVEVMGMENELSSPKDGKVIEAAVQEGRTVEGGATLFTIE